MLQLITILHILAALALIGLVLIQKGKGSDMGASFGAGASQTMFGSAGATPFLVKLTGMIAFAFFITCGALSFVVTKSTPPENIVQPVPLTTQLLAPQKESLIPTAQAEGEQKDVSKLDIPAPVTQAQIPKPVLSQSDSSGEGD